MRTPRTVIVAAAITIAALTLNNATSSANGLDLGPWTAVAACESALGHASDNLLQFEQATWDEVAAAAGRTDLVGVAPGSASHADQVFLADYVAFNHPGAGLERWPECGKYYGPGVCYIGGGWNVCNSITTEATPTPTAEPTATPTPDTYVTTPPTPTPTMVPAMPTPTQVLTTPTIVVPTATPTPTIALGFTG